MHVQSQLAVIRIVLLHFQGGEVSCEEGMERSRNKLIALIQKFGLPALFITLNCDHTKIKALLSLAEFHGVVSADDLKELEADIGNDPAAGAANLRRCLHVFFDVICNFDFARQTCRDKPGQFLDFQRRAMAHLRSISGVRCIHTRFCFYTAFHRLSQPCKRPLTPTEQIS
jgi:hypothetical protein